MFLDPIFAPLLKIPPFFAIFIISLVLSLIITIIYKLMTNQEEMHSLKADIKKHQQEMKASRDDPKKMMVIQKQAMDKNMKYMMQSMKPTLVTFIPVIFLLGWLSSHVAYYPIAPNVNFTTTAVFDSGYINNVTLSVPKGITLLTPASQQILNGQAKWVLNGEAGKYIKSLEYKFGGEGYTKTVIITDEPGNYEAPSEKISNSKLKEIRIDNKAIKPLGDTSIFGWHPGWLGTYIILSLIFSMSLRKLFKLA
jgi:uncharacterized membrane protein (DUF106 family)